MRKTDHKQEAILTALGEAVHQRRLNLGISQQELADQSELHRTYISDIERGARNLTVSTLGRIATALDVSPSKLFRQAEERVLGDRRERRR